MRARLAALLLLWAAFAGVAARADEQAIARGAYVAAAANCVGCHTAAGGAAFAGGRALQTPLGVIHATNITPDVETGIGAWRLEDFRRALRQGIAADGSYLFPAFPYTAYTRMSDADIADLYAYLQSLAPVRNVPPPNGLLFRLRWPMWIWNALFLDEGPIAEDPAQSAEWNRGAYLVRGAGHCGACHTPRNVFLAEDPDRAFQGAVVAGEVAPGVERDWFAVNLTSARQGLAAWSVTDLVKYFGDGYSAKGGSFGPMNEVVVNSLRHLGVEDRRAMAVYLKSLPGADYTGEIVAPAEAAAGEALYAKHCRKCHQANGRGNFLKAPPLAGSAVVQGANAASLLNVMLYGASKAEGVTYGAWERMPAFGDRLDDAQIAGIANYLRGSWGNRAAPVRADDVAPQR